MIVCISDIHFGRTSYEHGRQMERELITCLHHLEPNVEALVLLGDIFDCYIEYRDLLPKGLTRFQGLLAAWTDNGIPVTYVVGNHDPWHRDFFQRELGVDLHTNPIVRRLGHRTAYLAHGDGLTQANPIYYSLKPLLRNRLLVDLYRTVLPADLGMRLARWYSRTFADEEPDPAVVDDLRAHADEILRERTADLAVLGHTHVPEITRWPHGTYVNCGSWLFDRTFAVLDEQRIFIRQWNGTEASFVEQSQTVKENPEP